MARPTKIWIDYFPIDNDIESDMKIEMLEAEMGLEWFALLIKMLAMIYKDWYYIRRDERIAKIFAKRNNIEVNVVINFINVCINEDIFNKKVFNAYKIITSRWIQKRYIKACERRKEIYFTKQIMLIWQSEVQSLLPWVNVNINEINDDISTQSKVKYSKEEYSIAKEKLWTFIEKWNWVRKIGDKAWLPKTSKITDDLLNNRIKVNEKYTEEEIKIAMNNYCKEIEKRKKGDKENWYYDHRFTFLKFIKQSNGLNEFINYWS